MSLPIYRPPTPKEELDQQWSDTSDGERIARTLSFATEEVEGLDLLDVGCGSGWYARWATARGARVVAVDGAASALKQIKQRTECALLPNLPFIDESFDQVACLDVIGTLEPKLYALTISELSRLLRPGGELLLSTPVGSWRAVMRLEALLDCEFTTVGWRLSSKRWGRGRWAEWLSEKIAPKRSVSHVIYKGSRRLSRGTQLNP